MNRCEITRDLLPAYVDDIISQSGREYVDEHVSECEACKTALNEAKTEVRTENVEENITAKKPFKKVSLKKAIILSVAVIIGIVLLIYGFVIVSDILCGGYNSANRLFGIDTVDGIFKAAAKEYSGRFPEYNLTEIINEGEDRGEGASFPKNYVDAYRVVRSESGQAYLMAVEGELTGIDSYKVDYFNIVEIIDDETAWFIDNEGELYCGSYNYLIEGELYCGSEVADGGVFCPVFMSFMSHDEIYYSDEEIEAIVEKKKELYLSVYVSEEAAELYAKAERERLRKDYDFLREQSIKEMKENFNLPEEAIQEWMNFEKNTDTAVSENE